MSYAALIREMIEAGATPQVILIAVEAMEARDNAEADRKERAAARKRAQRDRERDSHATVTGRSQDMDGTDPLSPAPLLSPHTPQTTPHPHTPVSITPRAREAKPFDACPDGIEPSHWRDFLANRRAKRLPNTETAYRGVMRKLAELTNDEWPPGRLMQAIVEKGWASIHDPRNEQEFQNGHVRQPGFKPQYKPSAALALYQSSIEGDEPDSGHDWPALPASIGH